MLGDTNRREMIRFPDGPSWPRWSFPAEHDLPRGDESHPKVDIPGPVPGPGASEHERRDDETLHAQTLARVAVGAGGRDRCRTHGGDAGRPRPGDARGE